MASSNVTPSEDWVRFKPSVKQRLLLAAMTPADRSRYIQQAIEAEMREQPVLKAIPVEETSEESIAEGVLSFKPTPDICAWLEPIPPYIRAYVIRGALNRYMRDHPLLPSPQQQVLVEALA